MVLVLVCNGIGLQLYWYAMVLEMVFIMQWYVMVLVCNGIGNGIYYELVWNDKQWYWKLYLLFIGLKWYLLCIGMQWYWKLVCNDIGNGIYYALVCSGMKWYSYW